MRFDAYHVSKPETVWVCPLYSNFCALPTPFDGKRMQREGYFMPLARQSVRPPAPNPATAATIPATTTANRMGYGFL